MLLSKYTTFWQLRSAGTSFDEFATDRYTFHTFSCAVPVFFHTFLFFLLWLPGTYLCLCCASSWRRSLCAFSPTFGLPCGCARYAVCLLYWYKSTNTDADVCFRKGLQVSRRHVRGRLLVQIRYGLKLLVYKTFSYKFAQDYWDKSHTHTHTHTHSVRGVRGGVCGDALHSRVCLQLLTKPLYY